MAEEFELDVGSVAHGGHFVARHEGRVVFVRHALPGERVLARVTEDRGRSFLRADAVRVLRASPDRVAAPCPYAGPGACGGCDFQHAKPAAQRLLKAQVVAEQMARLADVPNLSVTVEELRGGPLGWRTRSRFAVTDQGVVGMYRHRARSVLPIEDCLLASPGVQSACVTRRMWPRTKEVLVAAPASGAATVAVRRSRERSGRWHVESGEGVITEHAVERDWKVSATGFWQVHPAAADVLSDAVVEALAPRPGEVCLDLYAGVGLFAGVLGLAVGESGRVMAVEGGSRAAALARENLSDLPQVSVVHSPVTKAAVTRARPSGSGFADVVVLDPPRSGAGKEIVSAIVSHRPRAVAYVACDPATLARDVAYFAASGYRLGALRAFDLFPMTHHVECVATLLRSDEDL